MDRFTGQGSLIVMQSAHGFSVGSAIKSSSGSWATAQANSDANLAQAVVTAVVDADRFIATMYGFVSAPKHGLGAAGTNRWLSQATPGATVTASPASGYVQYLLSVHDLDTLIVRVGIGVLL